MEDVDLSKRCKGVTQKGSPCKNKPHKGSDYCALHQPKSQIKDEIPETTPVLQPASVSSRVTSASPQTTARKANNSNFLSKAVTCIIAVLFLLLSCCCGLTVGTGFTAWLYETVEGPCYTQVVVKEFAVTQVVLTQVAGVPAPTYTFYPTYTQLLTSTPPPTLEPYPTIETSTATVEATNATVEATNATVEATNATVEATNSQEFTEIYRFNGTGKETTDLFRLDEGIIRVRWNHKGESNFSFSLKRLDTNEEKLLENAIGNAEGQAVLKVEASDQYIFDVTLADGDWEIVVEYRS
jgi:hypothetical protein